MTTLLAPIDLSTATRTGPRMYRKQILRKGVIQYPTPDGKSRKVTFDDRYLTDLAAAFNAGAYDDVPFILADASNAHNMLPERWRGWVKSVEVTPDGLDAILELSADAAELVERTGGKLGVSPRIRPVQHIDGRRFPLAINHVLGTLDARQQGPTLGLRPWQAVDLSADTDDDVLDLTGAHYQEGDIMPQHLDLSALTDDQRNSLTQWSRVHGIDLSTVGADDDQGDDDQGDDEPDLDTDELEDELEDDEPDEDDEDEGEGITDDELNALIDAELAGADLSAYDDAADDLDLAAGEHATAGDDQQADRRDAAKARADLAVDRYARKGVPTYILDLARPVLGMSDQDAETLDLSNPADGEPVDVRGIIRGILDAAAGTIDLSGEHGHGHELDTDGEGSETAARWLDHLNDNIT